MKRCSILRVIKKCKSKPQWDTTSQVWAIIKSCYLKKKKTENNKGYWRFGEIETLGHG